MMRSQLSNQRAVVSLLMVAMVVIGSLQTVQAKVWTTNDIYDQHKTKSRQGRKAELEHILEAKGYENYLEDYKALEEGIDQLKGTLEALDVMIRQTMDLNIEAKPGDKKEIHTTLGELESSNQQNSGLDMNQVEIVDVNVDEETKEALLDDVEKQLPKEVVDQLPEGWRDAITNELIDQVITNLPEGSQRDLLDQLPEEVKSQLLNVDLPTSSKGIQVTLAVDAKTYYMNMMMPALIQQKGAVKEAYDDVIKDNQLTIYIQMESLKIKNDRVEHIKKQRLLQEENKLNEQLIGLAVMESKQKEIEERLTLTKHKLLDEKERVQLGLSKREAVEILEQEMIDLEGQLQQVENKRTAERRTLNYSLGLGTEDELIIDVDSILKEGIRPMERETYLRIAKKNLVELAVLREQKRLYQEFIELGGEVYRPDDVSLLIMEQEKEKALLEINKNERLLILATQNVYDEYVIAYESYLVEQEAHEVAVKGYEQMKARHDVGILSLRAYEEAKVSMLEADRILLEAKDRYLKAYHGYIEGIMGLTGQ